MRSLGTPAKQQLDKGFEWGAIKSLVSILMATR